MNRIDAMLPKMIWDIEYYQKKDLYFHMMQIENIKHGCAHVDVKDYGDLILLGGYSYLGLIGHPG
jgi:hypothetical protein